MRHLQLAAEAVPLQQRLLEQLLRLRLAAPRDQLLVGPLRQRQLRLVALPGQFEDRLRCRRTRRARHIEVALRVVAPLRVDGGRRCLIGKGVGNARHAAQPVVHQLRHGLQEVAPALDGLAGRLGGNDDTHCHILRAGPARDAARICGALCGHRLEQRPEQARDRLFGTRGDPEPLRDGASHAGDLALLCCSQELPKANTVGLAGADQLLEGLQAGLRHAVCVCSSTAAGLRLLEVLERIGLGAAGRL